MFLLIINQSRYVMIIFIRNNITITIKKDSITFTLVFLGNYNVSILLNLFSIAIAYNPSVLSYKQI